MPLQKTLRSVRLIRNEKAFTLIEIMIVLAIMAAVVALSMPYISNRNSQNKKFLREFTILSRELHTKAKLQGVVFRMVLDLAGSESGGSDSNVPQTYWVEKSNGSSVIKPNEEESALLRAQEADAEKRSDPRGFEPDTSTIREPRELPSGMRIDKVELARAKDPIRRGKAYIHFMPQGLADEAAIHIKGEKKQVWTIAIHPLTGRAELIAKPISLKEITSQ